MKVQSGSIRFLTRSGCSICDAALARLGRIARLMRVHIASVDVDGDAELRELYGDRVPVVLGWDGRLLAEGPLTRRDAWVAAWSAKR